MHLIYAPRNDRCVAFVACNPNPLDPIGLFYYIVIRIFLCIKMYIFLTPKENKLFLSVMGIVKSCDSECPEKVKI